MNPTLILCSLFDRAQTQTATSIATTIDAGTETSHGDLITSYHSVSCRASSYLQCHHSDISWRVDAGTDTSHASHARITSYHIASSPLT